MAEPLAAVVAHEGFLPRVDSDVLLQVVLEFEGLATLVAAEFPQIRSLPVTQLVSLEAVDVGELFSALRTGWNWVLWGNGWFRKRASSLQRVGEGGEGG